MKTRVHAKQQQLKMCRSSPYFSIGVARYPTIGYSRLDIRGTIHEWAQRKAVSRARRSRPTIWSSLKIEKRSSK